MLSLGALLIRHYYCRCTRHESDQENVATLADAVDNIRNAVCGTMITHIDRGKELKQEEPQSTNEQRRKN